MGALEAGLEYLARLLRLDHDLVLGVELEVVLRVVVLELLQPAAVLPALIAHDPQLLVHRLELENHEVPELIDRASRLWRPGR